MGLNPFGSSNLPLSVTKPTTLLALASWVDSAAILFPAAVARVNPSPEDDLHHAAVKAYAAPNPLRS